MEKIYRIPRNLNAENSFMGCYSLGDLIMIVLLIMGSIFLTLATRIRFIIAIPVFFIVLRFKINGYSVLYWVKTAFSYISSSHIYTLFERSEIKWK